MAALTVEELLTPTNLPESFEDETALEEFMSRPTAETIADLSTLNGDIIVLGVAGKMGVTLARLAKRALPDRRVVGVARFSDESARQKLEAAGVETLQCDLLDPAQVAELPQIENVVFMAGLKFDSSDREPLMWAMNALVPAHVATHFAKSRIVALSSVLAYGWSDPRHGGLRENQGPSARSGEYANSVVARERIFQHFSRQNETPGRLLRFVYAIDPRYGVMQEIASWVLAGKPVPLATGTVNVQWQGDAINHFLRLLTHCETPATALNVGGPELVSVRYLAERFAERFDVEVQFEGTEEDKCLVVNCDQSTALLGNPNVSVDWMIAWVADWVASGKPTLGKPSKFEVRTGTF